MNELVFMRHNEPMTSSLAIAAGTENEHDSVLQLIKRYLDQLEIFGKIGFEVAPEGNSTFHVGNSVVEVQNPRDPKGRRTEFAFLNEPQATLLITFMRNSEIVVRFKVELVKAFYEMRGCPAVSHEIPLSLNHRADIAVAADRTFRAMMRSARTVGLSLPQALRRANEITLHKTGVDMLHELGAEDALTPHEATSHDHYGVARFFTDWIAGTLPVPFVTCRSSQFYRAYALWAGKNGVACCPISLFYTKAHAFRDRVKKGMVHTHDKTFRALIPVGAKVGVSAGEWQRHTAEELTLFDDALEVWEATSIN